MKILFFSDHFKPEPSAPAAHVHERARLWVKWGHDVTVVCSAPNFPVGKVYEGYRNAWRFVEHMDGIRVVRVKTLVMRNEGFALRTLDSDRELLNATIRLREGALSLLRKRYEAGETTDLDPARAESELGTARSDLAGIERRRANQEHALAVLTGVAPAQFGLAARPFDTAPVAVPAGLPSELLERRPDIAAAERQMAAANARIGIARAAFFPRISLTAQAGTASGELSGLFKNGSWGFTIAPSLLLPIFDAGRNQANLDSARVGREIAVAQYEKAIQTAFREVSDALAGQATLGEQAQAQQQQAQAEAARLQLADLRYRNGVASYLDLLDAQRSLFTAQQAVVQVRLAQLQNQVSLYKALGGGAPDTSAQAPS